LTYFKSLSGIKYIKLSGIKRRKSKYSFIWTKELITSIVRQNINENWVWFNENYRQMMRSIYRLGKTLNYFKKKVNPNISGLRADFIMWDEKKVIEILFKYPDKNTSWFNLNGFGGMLGWMYRNGTNLKYWKIRKYKEEMSISAGFMM